ncbi:recombinase family protein [Aeromonas caviae]
MEQDAERARELLIGFAAEHGHQIASFYVENESGATLDRPELMRLIRDAADRDIVLVEQIDRLARLNQTDWQTLKQLLAQKQLSIVSPELPTSWVALQGGQPLRVHQRHLAGCKWHAVGYARSRCS